MGYSSSKVKALGVHARQVAWVPCETEGRLSGMQVCRYAGRMVVREVGTEPRQVYICMQGACTEVYYDG